MSISDLTPKEQSTAHTPATPATGTLLTLSHDHTILVCMLFCDAVQVDFRFHVQFTLSCILNSTAVSDTSLENHPPESSPVASTVTASPALGKSHGVLSHTE